MIRVVLPLHLCNLASTSREITLEVEGAASISTVLDALEARYPMLRGTIRDQVTLQRTTLHPVLRLRGGSIAGTAHRPTARGGGFR